LGLEKGRPSSRRRGSKTIPSGINGRKWQISEKGTESLPGLQGCATGAFSHKGQNAVYRMTDLHSKEREREDSSVWRTRKKRSKGLSISLSRAQNFKEGPADLNIQTPQDLKGDAEISHVHIGVRCGGGLEASEKSGKGDAPTKRVHQGKKKKEH